MLEAYLPYLMGALAMFVFRLVAEKAGLKLPNGNGGGAPAPSQPAPAVPALPNHPVLDAIANALKNLLLARLAGAATPQEQAKAVDQILYDLSPDKRPE
jgi:hypothetical protein